MLRKYLLSDKKFTDLSLEERRITAQELINEGKLNKMHLHDIEKC